MEDRQENSLKRKREEEKQENEFVIKKARIAYDKNPNLLWQELGHDEKLNSSTIAEILKNNTNFKPNDPKFIIACGYIDETNDTIDTLQIEESLKIYIKDLKHIINEKLHYQIIKEHLLFFGKPDEQMDDDKLYIQGLLKFPNHIYLLDSYKRGALARFAKMGNVEMVELLIKLGFDVNAQEIDFTTPLIHAVLYSHDTITQLLLENGANPNLPKEFGFTALMEAVKKTGERKNELSIVKTLIDKGANLNLQNQFGDTALMIATMFSNRPMVEILLENKADKNIKDKKNRTALDIAYAQANEPIINLLEDIN